MKKDKNKIIFNKQYTISRVDNDTFEMVLLF